MATEANERSWLGQLNRAYGKPDFRIHRPIEGREDHNFYSVHWSWSYENGMGTVGMTHRPASDLYDKPGWRLYVRFGNFANNGSFWGGTSVEVESPTPLTAAQILGALHADGALGPSTRPRRKGKR